jgi:hypothetical protein
LLEAGLVKPAVSAKKGAAQPAVHAPQPEQTVNIDLCVVPISHEAKSELVWATLAAAAKENFSPSGDPNPS